MTYRRKPGSIETAITKAVNLLTLDDIEALTGKTRSSFEKTMNPHHRSQITLKDCARLDAGLSHLHGFTVFDKALSAQTFLYFQELTDDKATLTPLRIHLSRVMAEIGDVAEAYAQAIEPGSEDGEKISAHEICEIYKEVEEVRAALDHMAKDLLSRQGAKP